MATPSNITVAEGNLFVESVDGIFDDTFWGNSNGLGSGYIRAISDGYTDFEIDDLIIFALTDANKNQRIEQFEEGNAGVFNIISTADVKFKYTIPEA